MATATLTKVSVTLQRGTIATGTLVACITSSKGGTPLAEDSLAVASIPVEPNIQVFDFDFSLTVTQGMGYYLELRWDDAPAYGSDPNYARIGVIGKVGGVNLSTWSFNVGSGLWVSNNAPLTVAVYFYGDLYLNYNEGGEDAYAILSETSPRRAISIVVPVITDPPNKATTPSPTDAHEGDKLSLAETTWVDGGGAASYNVYFGPTDDMELVGEGLTDPTLNLETGIILNYLTEYSWRVDSINEYGTTTGDVWTFTTLRFAPPLPTGVTIDDDGEPTGTPTGENAMIQVKRLVVAANNKIWYESI